jgi:radical SAM/Cys-rich protein
MLDSLPYLKNSDFPPLHRDSVEILQLNLGYLCNLSCVHCHVNAGPKRKELMDSATLNDIYAFIEQTGIHTLDLTGGAPEMNPHFKSLIQWARKLNLRVIDRCNLTILLEPGYEDMAAFLADHQVEIIASLPCYLEDNVDKQRGKGTFQASIQALQQLNDLGYGQAHRGLVLNLVFNPQDAVLPPAQQPLEMAYKAYLKDHFNIVFNHLYAITNQPIQRFGSVLLSQGKFDAYMALLREHFQADNLAQVMCKNTLSIDWQGFVYDCDFNQMLQLPLGNHTQAVHIRDLMNRSLKNEPIHTLLHCYACTAGQGSSCQGAL